MKGMVVCLQAAVKRKSCLGGAGKMYSDFGMCSFETGNLVEMPGHKLGKYRICMLQMKPLE